MDSLYACQGNGPFSPYSDDLIKDFNTICGGPDPVAVDTICEALMDWDDPGTNVPSTVLGAAEGLGTNHMDEIELAGRADRSGQAALPAAEHDAAGPVSQRQRDHGLHLRSRLQGHRAHSAGSACRPMVRSNAGAAALRLHRTAIRGEDPPRSTATCSSSGDCAKGMLERFPDANYWGECEEYPNCTPIWANRPDVGIAQLRPAARPPFGGARGIDHGKLIGGSQRIADHTPASRFREPITCCGKAFSSSSPSRIPTSVS